MQKYY